MSFSSLRCHQGREHTRIYASAPDGCIFMRLSSESAGSRNARQGIPPYPRRVNREGWDSLYPRPATLHRIYHAAARPFAGAKQGGFPFETHTGTDGDQKTLPNVERDAVHTAAARHAGHQRVPGEAERLRAGDFVAAYAEAVVIPQVVTVRFSIRTHAGDGCASFRVRS